jgi:single-stranded-DNA-specific exonuclease
MNRFSRLDWKIFSANEDAENRLASLPHIHRLIARLLVNRGFDSIEKAEKFLNVTLDDLHSPFLMAGMEEAVERILRAIRGKEKIVVFGDYDVDGISATALLFRFFRDIGVDISCYIPHRIEEGYGLNPKAIRSFAKEKVELVITVDCGVTSVEEVNLASTLGIDVIITDHHQVSQELPSACALLNPVGPFCRYPFKYLAGVGIAFKLVSALTARLEKEGVISSKNAPGLKQFLDLVALGTLADMVPLVGENHILVRLGLEVMTKSRIVGLKALMNLGNFGKRPLADSDIGFFLAPRLNAIGRLQNAGLGVELLTTTDRFRAKKIARLLEEENSKRQSIQDRILNEVLPRIEREVDLKKDKAVILASEGWHPGIIGIVASKIVERYHLPAILLDITDGVCKGSARSIPAFHVYNGLNQCRDLLLHFGGHKYAAGLSLKADMLEAFKTRFNKIAAEALSSEKTARELKIDSVIPLYLLSPDMVEDIQSLGPFGQQNPYPLFLSREVKFSEKPVFVGKAKEHVMFEVESGDFRVNGIGYGMSNLFQTLDCENDAFDIVYIPTLTTRAGLAPGVQIKLYDIRPSQTPVVTVREYPQPGFQSPTR